MALFGRRKPGFAKEVELKPSEIPGEFSDALDPAVNKALDNPKLEKAQMAAQAAEVLGEEKPELLDYLESLPDVADPFPPSEPEPEPAPAPEKTRAQLLADYIRERTRATQLTALASLREDDEEIDALLAELQADETCKDILSVQGAKDVYYYSEDFMAHNYAKVAMLVLEKDIPRTMAEMVRFNCKAFPTPTPLYYFKRQPYFFTMPQMRHAIDQMHRDPQYADIQELTTTNNNEPYLFSEPLMSRRYAQALANSAEAREGDE